MQTREPATVIDRLRSSHRFGVFVAGQTVSAFGDAFANVAMPLLVLAVTGSVVQMGLVAGVSTASQLCSSFFAGGIVERLDRRRLMIAGDAVQMVLTAAVPATWLLLSEPAWQGAAIWVVYVVVIASSIINTVYRVALSTFVPQFVGRDALTQANGRLTMATEIAYGIGPAIAGLAVAAFGAPVAIGINALTFGASALALLAIVAPRAAGTVAGAEHAELSARLAGLRFVWRHDRLRPLTILDVLHSLLVAGVFSLFIYFLTEDLGQGSAVVGVMLSLASVGAVLATLVVAPMRARFGVGPSWLAFVALQGVALAGVAISTSIVLVGFLATLFALGQVAGVVLATTRRQELTPDHALPRVSAAVVMAFLAMQAIGIPAMTSAAGVTSSRTVFVAAGLLVLAVAVAGTRTRVWGDRSVGGAASSVS